MVGKECEKEGGGILFMDSVQKVNGQRFKMAKDEQT